MKTRTLIGSALFTAATAALAADPVIRPLALDAADAYREQARYPHSSHPIRDAVDPILRKREPSKQLLPGPNGDGPFLSIWTSAISYEPGESASLYAELVDNTPKAPSLANLLDRDGPRGKAASITAKLIAEDGGLLGDIEYRDDGKGADRRAGDGIYSARFVMPAARAPQSGHADSVAVHVQALTAKGEPRGALGGFLYSNPGARLTGRYRETMRDGSMIISAEVDVKTPGRYHLSGTLATPVAGIAERPMAWAQNAAVMQTGKQWLELNYYGLIFHELAATGPFTLASVTLTSALGMPNAMSAVQRDVFQTRAHALTEFATSPFADAGLLQAAERLESVVPGRSRD